MRFASMALLGLPGVALAAPQFYPISPLPIDTPTPTPLPIDTPTPTPLPIETPTPTPLPIETPTPIPFPIDLGDLFDYPDYSDYLDYPGYPDLSDLPDLPELPELPSIPGLPPAPPAPPAPPLPPFPPFDTRDTKPLGDPAVCPEVAGKYAKYCTRCLPRCSYLQGQLYKTCLQATFAFIRDSETECKVAGGSEADCIVKAVNTACPK
ncbi:hypothetical protein ACO1O0_003558 [Amphichorda felina]